MTASSARPGEEPELTPGSGGDLPPFDQVVGEHGGALLRICRGLAGPGECEDVWEETFLAALLAYPRLRPGSNVRGWLVTIAHRKAVDCWRARARAPLSLNPGTEPAGRVEPPGDPEPGLWAAVAALPPRQRASVAYHYAADLPYREVGKIMGVTEAAARRAAADGIASLRSKTGRRHFDDPD